MDLPAKEGVQRNDTAIRTRLLLCLAVAGLMFFAIWALLPSVSTPKEAARTFASKDQLKQIGLAIHNYHDEFKELPAPVTYSESGTVLHGWPVALLPYLDQKTLYGSIDLSNPHTDPKNRSAMQVYLQQYWSPLFDDRARSPDLHYALSNRIFRRHRGMKLRDVKDGTSSTFLGGEISQGIRPWYVPGHIRDPGIKFNSGPDSFGSPLFGKRYYHGTHMLMLDGSVVTVTDDIDPAVQEALATPDAGDDSSKFFR